MKNEIFRILRFIEKNYDVTVLYASESGSRAYGFNNSESDYDVRFIFKYNQIQKYLSISDVNDVIEYNAEKLDFVGWDIKKALKLHYASNPNLREWLISPEKYIDWQRNIFNDLNDFDSSKLKYHYTSIARNNWKRLSQKNFEINKQTTKILLYNCRCVLTWLAIDAGDNPPINIFDLLDIVSTDANCDINALISYYKNNCQDSIDLEVLGNVIEWIDSNLAVMIEDLPEVEKSRNFDDYNQRFFEIVMSNYE